ncbi:hypothetical protein MKW94_008915 [Papaver nudicaule]|uniref:Uncharacterized protein n=1 Tax=Papaver nudicaule TaxID=74823 RepID=A0AA41SCD7_PAPNU|nr:hypothetical protein [Papaver nudicaule]
MNNLLVQQQNPLKNEKLIVILGATATGKSRLSMPVDQRRGIPHHLIDEYDSVDGELTAGDFRLVAASRVSDIWSRNRLPILVGGSNSYIHAFLAKHFDSNSEGSDFKSLASPELRYDCCFLWLYVSPSVLKEYIYRRVQEMLDAGMLEELSKFFETEMVQMEVPPMGIKKSIGVPEFERYFKVFPPAGKTLTIKGCNGIKSHRWSHPTPLDKVGSWPPYKHGRTQDFSKTLLEEAIQTMKENTYALAKRQVEKIEVLRSSGWNILKLDETEVLQTKLATEPDSAKSSKVIWEKKIVEPSMKIVKQFSEE